MRLLPVALAEAGAALAPVDPEELLVLLGRTAKIWKLPDDWDETAEFYAEALEDLPRDLVHSALKHCRLSLKWFPKPSELRAPVEAELQRRRDVLRRLRLMEQKARLGDVAAPVLRAVPTAEQKAEAEAMAEEARRVLAEVSLKRVPARSDDERGPVSLADAYAATRDALAARAAARVEPAAAEPAAAEVPT